MTPRRLPVRDLGPSRPLRPSADLPPAARGCAALRTFRSVLAAAMLALAGSGAALLSPPAAQAQDRTPATELQGRFEGVGPARGMRIVITDVDSEPGGRFTDSNGVEAEIKGGWRDGALEALLNFPGRPVFVRLAPSALGLQMAVLPMDADGRPQRQQARILAFLREGVQAPDQPALYQDAPKRAGQETDADVFLASYQYWEPEGVANGFDNIGARYRTMIRLFPQLHADVLWKLCASTSQQALLAEALRGQGASCADITRTVERLRDRGRFDDWKRAVQEDIDALTPAVQCARGYIVKESVCGPASRRVAQAATSLETLGSTLANW